jgi:hypothetical protein
MNLIDEINEIIDRKKNKEEIGDSPENNEINESKIYELESGYGNGDIALAIDSVFKHLGYWSGGGTDNIMHSMKDKLDMMSASDNKKLANAVNAIGNWIKRFQEVQEKAYREKEAKVVY